MKKIGLSCLLPLGICVSGASWAADFESCNALLKVGVYNIKNTDNKVETSSVALSSFCQADYSQLQEGSSQATEIGLSYKVLSFNFGSSGTRQQIITKQTEYCKYGFDSNKYSSQATAEIKSIYQGSLDAWNQCQKLSLAGISFDMLADESGHSASVTMTANSGSSIKFQGLMQTGIGRSTCQTTLPARTGSLSGQVITVDASTSFSFDASNKLTIVCSRNLGSDGKGNYGADKQRLTFNTSAGPYHVDLAAVGDLSRLTVDNVIERAKAAARDPGTVIAFAGSTCPAGTLLANGAAVDKLTYSKLSAAIGTSHGGGGNTFNLPDYRGRFLRGVDGGAGNDPDRASRTAMSNGGSTGDAVGSVQTDAFKTHYHGISRGAWGFYGGGGSNNAPSNGAFEWITRTDDAGTSQETRPKNANVNYCVYY